MYWQDRQRAVTGERGLQLLARSHVVVVGLGGVGGAAAEGVVRAGVGRVTLVDFDTVALTDKNRQLLALDCDIGKPKTQVAARRYREINPSCEITELPIRVDADSVGLIFDGNPDFIIDAIDDVAAKLLIIERCVSGSVGVVTSMGTGNRLDPTAFRVGTVSQTAGCGCPLARVMRRELLKRGLGDIPAVFSDELPIKPSGDIRVGSISFVPPVAGFALAGYAVNSLLAE